MARQFFISLYAKEANTYTPYSHRGLFPPIPANLWTTLTAVVNTQEVQHALFDMKSLKAPGPDGLHAFFFQHQWETTGESLCNLVSKVFEGEQLDPELNKTFITLIPKVPCPQRLTEFRPISLCSVAYKVLTKVLANRLKPIMPSLVLPYQTSFIKGRNIIDNIIIAQEVIHSMRMKRGKKGWMAIKVDLEKAFDRLSWSFINETLQDALFPDNIIHLIMHCIMSPSMQVLWNGRPTEAFFPGCGIRQGDPLSPYIFVLCMERLSQTIQAAVNQREWETIKMGKGGPPLSHLFFADDLILFGSTSANQIGTIKRILDDFCLSSGHSISRAKTRIFFSKNVPKQEADAICSQLGYSMTGNLGKYLGVPLLHSRITKETYHYLVERFQQKLSSWKAKSLSLAGRITLAKSALSTIPYYAMQTSSLPSSCCYQMEKIIRNFIWGADNQHSSIHSLNWDEVCQPIENGGCGLRKLTSQNSAFLSKLGFLLVSQTNLLWVKVLRAKYRCTDQLKPKFKTYNPSHVWRSIGKVWPDTELSIKWNPGNGQRICFWGDNWIGDLGPLKNLAFIDVPEEDLKRPIRDFVNDHGQWRWELFQNHLPMSLTLLIATTSPPTESDGDATCMWNLTPNGSFTVSSAYKAKEEMCWNDASRCWTLIWNWPGAQRIRSFLWLAYKNRLLTNSERLRRRLITDATCELCRQAIEDIDHIFRQCPFAVACWKLVIPEDVAVRFLTAPLQKWWIDNINPKCASNRWILFFGILTWKIWTIRNKRLFTSESFYPAGTIAATDALTTHSLQAMDSYLRPVPSI